METITSAISKGDLVTLSSYLDDTVEISVMEKGDIYLKKEAIDKLKAFFDTSKPASFQSVHRGESEGKSSLYCIGNLTTNTNNYRVYLYIKVQQGQYYIQEIRFDKN